MLDDKLAIKTPIKIYADVTCCSYKTGENAFNY